MTDHPRAPQIEPDPPEFKPELVPDTEFGEQFRDGKTGRGLTDAEYDEHIARLESLAVNPSLDETDREAAREILRGIRGRA